MASSAQHRMLAAVAIGLVIVLAAVLPRGATARAARADIVQLADGTAIHLATPPFLQVAKRYAFTWPGGGPPQTFTIRAIRPDGWILVDVADENIRPDLYVPGEFATRWLHVGLAISVQEMRPLP
jgi:hypothetical protein